MTKYPDFYEKGNDTGSSRIFGLFLTDVVHLSHHSNCRRRFAPGVDNIDRNEWTTSPEYAVKKSGGLYDIMEPNLLNFELYQ